MAIYGTKNDDTIDAADGVTNGQDIIFGLDGKDTIYGLGGDDVMKGGGGADTFYGGAGHDEANYQDSPEAIGIDLPTHRGWGGTADGDLLFSIENISGSPYNDVMKGDAENNVLRGWDGRDRLWGGDGNDVLEGGVGDDQLYGGSFSDSLYGGGDNDYLEGGAGADHLFGGDGFDEASYFDSPEAVVVSLFHHVATGGDAKDDTFDSIERLAGSRFNDHLYGDDGDNRISGIDGHDTLKGFGGNDVLWGGDGFDTLIGGDGLDELWGGEGEDRFVWTFAEQTGKTIETADVIGDFWIGEDDRIDLSAIDADVYADGNQAFTFIGMNAFSGTPGEIRYEHVDGNTYIQLQTGTSADVEGVIRLSGIVDPQANWFIL